MKEGWGSETPKCVAKGDFQISRRMRLVMAKLLQRRQVHATELTRRTLSLQGNRT